MTELEKKGKAALVPSGWDYAPAPESREIVRIDERYGHFVGGEWLEPKETYETISPSSEEPLAAHEVAVAFLDPDDVARLRRGRVVPAGRHGDGRLLLFELSQR